MNVLWHTFVSVKISKLFLPLESRFGLKTTRFRTVRRGTMRFARRLLIKPLSFAKIIVKPVNKY